MKNNNFSFHKEPIGHKSVPCIRSVMHSDKFHNACNYRHIRHHKCTSTVNQRHRNVFHILCSSTRTLKRIHLNLICTLSTDILPRLFPPFLNICLSTIISVNYLYNTIEKFGFFYLLMSNFSATFIKYWAFSVSPLTIKTHLFFALFSSLSNSFTSGTLYFS